jgi:pyrroline-5-carboxylate reductase
MALIGYHAGRSERRERNLSASDRVLLIGFGNMGQALARGWLAHGREAASVRVVEAADAARAVAVELGLDAVAEIDKTEQGADVIVLAVKPNQLVSVLPAAARRAGTDALVLSIAAGKTLAQIEAGLGASLAVVRAMPNTPAAIGQGMTALVGNARVSQRHQSLATDLMAAVGAVAWLADEAQMDAVTAVSGSGPAYVFLLVECLEQAGRELGLDAGLARQLAVTTIAGAGRYAASVPLDPAELRRRVTSPNGTTQAALDVLMGAGGLQPLVTRAVRAAAARSRELAQG